MYYICTFYSYYYFLQTYYISLYTPFTIIISHYLLNAKLYIIVIFCCLIQYDE